MANYNVDIAVALKGAQKLTAFNKDVKTTKLQVDGLNKTLKNIAKDQQLFIRSFKNLNTVIDKSHWNNDTEYNGRFHVKFENCGMGYHDHVVDNNFNAGLLKPSLATFLNADGNPLVSFGV